MSTLEKKTRRELVEAVSARYTQSTKAEKAKILDEFVAITGYHRKAAIRVLNAGELLKEAARRKPPSIYDEAVQEALVVLWEASDRICGKRLKPLLPLLISALERHGHIELDNTVREKLLKVSPATIDRLLAPARAATGRRARRRKVPAVRGHVPVRTFGDWQDPLPGFMEVDRKMAARRLVFRHISSVDSEPTQADTVGNILVRTAGNKTQ